MNHSAVVLLTFAVVACTDGPRDTAGAGGDAQTSISLPASDDAAWLLSGTLDERFNRVARHLRGFDVAMAETGYRYTELYWAGADRNWGYAAYQLGKIEVAVANGTERRPRRAASARMLDPAVQRVRAAIAGQDPVAFDTTFAVLTATCNECHTAEGVPFITVRPPDRRLSPVGGFANPPGGP